MRAFTDPILLSCHARLWYIHCVQSKTIMTLDRVLSRFGVASRSVSSEWIRSGRVKINGLVVRDPGHWVRTDHDSLHLDGKRLKQAHKVYLLFYKPKGVVATHGDPDARATIYDYLDKSIPWVAPVGRLDMDSSGLLLLTNDTEFANFVSDPASGIAKTYLIKVNGLVSSEIVAKLASGIRMKRGDWARPGSVQHLADRGKYSRLEIVLQEGKNREVRRMVEAVGFKVLKLVRTGIGPLSLEGLQIGTFRHLTREEVTSLRQKSVRRPRIPSQ